MTEQLAKNVEPADKLSDQQASEYLSFYLDKIGASDVESQLSRYDKRIMSDMPLLVQLDPLAYADRPKTERDKMVRFFEEDRWLPVSRNEATIASDRGVDGTIDRIRRISRGDPAGAARSTYHTLKGYYAGSVEDNKVLNSVLDPSEDLSIDVSVPKLRSSRQALYVLADNLMAREFLDRQEWPNRNWKAFQERQNYWRGFMLFAGEHASDEVLADSFNHILEKVRNRRHYWDKNFKTVNKRLGHLMVEDVAETKIPHRPVEEIRYKTGRHPDIESFNEMLADKAVDDLAAAAKKYADKTDQIMRYVQDQGMTRQEAELRVLGRLAEWHEGFIVGFKPRLNKPSQEAIENAKRPKPKAAANPGVRSLSGYDKQDDPSNPRPF